MKVTQAFSNAVLKHESYANLIEDDELFIQEELWLEQCQNEFLKLKGMVATQDSDNPSNSNPTVDTHASVPK